MKKSNKGFTIVELVIVIAVIAILAAVLVPTFSNVIKKANASSAMQACKSAFEDALAEAIGDGYITATEEVTSGPFTFTWNTDDAMYDVTVECSGNEKYEKFEYEINEDTGAVEVTAASAT